MLTSGERMYFWHQVKSKSRHRVTSQLERTQKNFEVHKAKFFCCWRTENEKESKEIIQKASVKHKQCEYKKKVFPKVLFHAQTFVVDEKAFFSFLFCTKRSGNYVLLPSWCPFVFMSYVIELLSPFFIFEDDFFFFAIYL